MKLTNIAFIGAGNMAQALIRGLVSIDYPADKIIASNPPRDDLKLFQQQLGIHYVHDNQDAVAHADVVVLAVKPNVMSSVCQELKTILIHRKPLVISVAAGVTLSALNQWLEASIPIVRAMPNTPVAVSAGVTGLFAGDHVSNQQKNQAETLFRSVGLTVWVKQEKDINLIIALSGSGPAYCFLVMEAMQNAAVQLGLDTEVAQLLSLQTALGAAKMAIESQRDVAQLRQSVTSPNGTTAAALEVFNKGNMKQLFERAMRAAVERAESLEQELT